MTTELIARWDETLRPLLVRLPPRLVIALYSAGRRRFLAALVRRPPAPWTPPAGLARVVWGLRFRAPLGNAAGMFKNGEGYELCAAQGAGWYLAGSTTAVPRTGNRAHGIYQPFVPYPLSGAAANWLGLPNDGDPAVARRLAGLRRVDGCPVGVSLSPATDLPAGEPRLAALVRGLQLYDEAGADFLEVNESCPNVADCGVRTDGEPEQRLAEVSARFLRHRQRPLPVIVKFSCDTAPEQVPGLVETLVRLGFDGVNFGNTATAYDRLRPAIAVAERPLFDAFCRSFGGGVSGRPLKQSSLELAAAAVEHVRRLQPGHEFQVVRTGGVENAADLRAADAAGVALCQWYTGYFAAFAHHGHALYRRLCADLSTPS